MTYQLDEIRVFGIPVSGLLQALHIGLPDLIALERDGVSLQQFSLLLDHRRMFPPPRLEGNIATARLTEEGLHLRFADNLSVQFDPPPALGESYIWIQSGDPKLFGLVITNARIAILPKPGTDALKFDLYNYREQLSHATGRIDEDSTITLTMDK